MNNFFLSWYNCPIKGSKTFNDMFNIDGIPLGHFYTWFFNNGTIPSQIMGKRKTNKIIAILMRKAILINELRKIKESRKVKPSLDKKDCLFISYTNQINSDGYFRIQRILDILDRNKLCSYDVIVSDTLQEIKIKHEDESYFYSYVTDDIISDAKAKADLLYKEYKVMNREYLIEKQLSENYHDFVDYAAAFKMFMSRDMFTLIYIYYLTSLRIIRIKEPKVIVSTGLSGLLEKTLGFAAIKEKIRSVLISHALFQQVPSCYNDAFRHVTDLIVFTKQQDKLFKGKIKKPFNVFVGGAIIYEDAIRYINKEPKENNVLIATSPFVEEGLVPKSEYISIVKGIRDQVYKENSKAIITIKPHPREKIDKYKNLNITVVSPTLNKDGFHKLISDSEIFIHFGSTSLYEARIINRPCVAINILPNFGFYKTESNFKKTGIYLRKISHLSLMIKNIRREKHWIRKDNLSFIKSELGKVDGKSSSRIAHYVAGVVRNAS